MKKLNSLEEIIDYINENNIYYPLSTYWMNFANTLGFDEECRKFKSQLELYKSDFWANERRRSCGRYHSSIHAGTILGIPVAGVERILGARQRS